MISAPRPLDRIARKHAASPVADAAGYERTIERTQSLLRPSDVVFEFGCGTGTTALKLAPGMARLAASDISGEMIAIAHEKAQAAGCANVEFQWRRRMRGPADATFDEALGFTS